MEIRKKITLRIRSIDAKCISLFILASRFPMKDVILNPPISAGVAVGVVI